MDPRLRSPIAAILLVILTVAIYAPVRDYPFINYDDTDYITENHRVQSGFRWENVRWAFTTSHAANWHPLTWLSHLLDMRLFGLWAGGHHLMNAALHALNALLLFLVLRALTGAIWPSFWIAALFAAHPLRVESVAWVAERKDLLAGFFWMAGLGVWIRYLRRPSVRRYLAVVGLLALGLMAKPTMVTFPLILLLLDWWPLGRWGHEIRPESFVARAGVVPQIRDAPAPARPLVLEKAPLILISATSAVITYLVQRSWGAMDSADLAAPAVRLGNAAVSYLRYIAKTVWPQRLAVFYPHPTDQLPWWLAWGAAAALAGLALIVLRVRRGQPWLAVGWFWYLLSMAPMIGLVQVGTQGLADRYTYLPLVGPVLALVWGVSEASRRRGRTLPAVIAAAAAVLALSLAARHQVGYWKNSETLFRQALAVSGRSMVAEKQLAGALAEQGRWPEALSRYNEALKISPNDFMIYNNIGLILAETGRLEEALANYRTALRLRPSYPETHNNLGIALGMTGAYTEAAREFREALRLRTDYPEAHMNLGSALDFLGRPGEAITENREALDLNPRLAMGHNNLGVYLDHAGKREEAIAEYREALRLDPGCKNAQSNLAEALAGAPTRSPGSAELRPARRDRRD